MQFFAWDSSHLPIPASRAEKQKDYLCPECGRAVRLKKGLHRQPHFFHPAAASCRQSQKSGEHLQAQYHLLSLIPDGEGAMERPFSEVGRIADVVWETEKIVFEVQCSPITLSEAQERGIDYRRVGYEIVWILHQKNFNRRRLSAAENWLRTQPCYFTDFSAKGSGKIYDQLEILRQAKRVWRGAPLPLVSLQPHRLPPPLSFPALLEHRATHWPLYLGGDLLDRWIRDPLRQESKGRIDRLAHRLASVGIPPFGQRMKTLYLRLIDTLLTICCKKQK